MTIQQPRIAAILLAAGESTRMGQPKALLPWAGVPLVRHQVNLLAAQPAINQLIVVLGSRQDELRAALQGAPARVIVNPRFREGRATSLAAGAHALEGQPISVLVVNVDQPLATDLLDPLLAAWRTEPGALWRPSYEGQGGHPLIIPADVAPELAHVTEIHPGPARRRHPPPPTVFAPCPCESQLAVLNLNTPADYAAAQPSGGPAPSPKLSAGP